LSYALNVDPTGAERLSAVWIHRGTVEKPEAARHQLFAPGLPADGSVTLSFADRNDLADGRLLVRVFLRDTRGSAADVPLSFPQ
jgi:hypothetical protein